MKKTVLLLASMALAVLLAAGMALAATVSCPTGPDGACEGTEERDRIEGTNAVDNIEALGGNDVLIPAKGKDHMDGGSGNDRYRFGDVSDYPGTGETITADESGVDTLDFSGLTQSSVVRHWRPGDTHQLRSNTSDPAKPEWSVTWPNVIENFLGGSGNEVIYGFGRPDVPNVLRLGAGEDYAVHSEGSPGDRVYFGPGNDRTEHIDVRQYNDKFFGGPGDDDLWGVGGTDLLDGGPGADTLKGGGLRDVLRAADGEADRLIDCGGNRDTVYYDAEIDPEPVNCEVLNP